jgi:hypothetical protein
MERFLALSVDPDTMQWIADFILAEDGDSAGEWVEKYRDDCRDLQVFTAENLREWANDMETRPEQEIRDWMNELEADAVEADAHVCDDECRSNGCKASYPGGVSGGVPNFNKANTDYVERMNRQ